MNAAVQGSPDDTARVIGKGFVALPPMVRGDPDKGIDHHGYGPSAIMRYSREQT